MRSAIVNGCGRRPAPASRGSRAASSIPSSASTFPHSASAPWAPHSVVGARASQESVSGVTMTDSTVWEREQCPVFYLFSDDTFGQKVLSPNPERIVFRFIFLDFFRSPIFFGIGVSDRMPPPRCWRSSPVNWAACPCPSTTTLRMRRLAGRT
jgi:hypothetical protein